MAIEFLKPVPVAVAFLLAARCLAQLWLSLLNSRHVKSHSTRVPAAFKEVVAPSTYAKSVDYTLSKGRFDRFDQVFRMILLALVLFSGLLPAISDRFAGGLGESVWAMAAFVFCVGALLSLVELPVDWVEQFRLEERFGFNTSTQRTWWGDRVKGFLLAAVIGYPLLVLVLKLVDWTGGWWWLWAAGTVVAFQFLMLVLAPVLIMPLFNKFQPLPEGTLKERLLELANQTGFRARGIEVMDGSRRSKHSNAFFTGFGRYRKIVLFDTLIEQLNEPELAAVLAHEIGHFRRKHIPKLMAVSVAGLFAGFAVLGWLAKQDWFYRAFGFESGNVAVALLLFGLLSGTFTFWLSPLMNWWSRRFEYEADHFAAKAVGTGASLITALRKMYEKNLGNLTPHPIYSGFHYSHPTLLERERALAGEPGK